MEALEQLKGVLCDPEGNVCIHGHDEDRRIVQKFIDGYADQLREAQVKMLREAADDAEKYIDYPIDEEDITFYGHLEFMVRHLRRMADDLEKKTCGRCNTQPTYKHASGFPLCIDCYNDLTVNERKTES